MSISHTILLSSSYNSYDYNYAYFLRYLQALLEAGSHNPDNLARSSAQKALEPLPLDAGLLIPLLQPPALAPPTPVPTPKRFKKAKSPKTPLQTPLAYPGEFAASISTVRKTLSGLKSKASKTLNGRQLKERKVC